MQTTSKEYLSEIEVAAIERFCSDKVAFNAVKKVLFEGVYYNGVMMSGAAHNPLRNPALSLVARQNGPVPTDKEIADDLRAQWSGITTIEVAFKDLEKIKAVPKAVEEKNPSNKAR